MFSTGEVKVVISIVNKLTPATEEGKVTRPALKQEETAPIAMVCTA